ncbi:transglycosylase SLT domain-containing protein [Streptomyces sp. NPDC002513]
MADNLDIVGTAAVDVVPIAPNFHDKLKAIVLPAADRVGRDAGQRIGDAISRNITISIPDAIVAGGQRARVAATREGGQVGGAFANAIKRKLEVAFRSLPRADVRLGDTGFNADLDRLRARIQTLSGKTVGIDVDAGAALAEITAIDAELRRLGAEHPDVNVRSDTAAARAALAEIQAQINEVDRDDVHVRVDVDTSGALSALRGLAIALGGVAAIPVVPVGAAAIGAIASAAVAAGAGVGSLALAAIPAIKGVTTAIQAKSAAEKEASTSTDNSAAADKRAAQSALQMASAQQSLTAAHRNAARSIAQANRQVADAERAVADAVQRAADQRRQAAQNVEHAERSLADAQKQARQAEEALTQARADAAQQLADLNDKLTDGALSQRDAALQVQEAADQLAKVKAANQAGTASDTELARAQLSYDQAVQAQKEQSKSYEQLQKDADKARKAGVDGNDAVKKAADQLANAQQTVKDQTAALAQAHRDAARTEVQAARAVADAQRSLADAVQSAADTQVQAADSIASAERGVESARLSSIDTTTKAATKTDAYRKALANLTPEQRKLYDSIAGPQGLTAAFKAWSTSLQPDVLPLFTRGVDGAKASLPGLTPLVKTAADAIGLLMDKASRGLKTPFWRGFKKDIETSAEPAIVGLGVAFGNVLAGMAGIVDAFLPHMNGISSTMQRITGRFADWGKGLRGSPAFEAFLKYAADKGPLIAQALGGVASALIAVGTALSPISGPLLQVISAVATGVASVANTLPWLIQLIYGVWVATKLWTIALAAFNLVMEANPIVLIITGIVALVAAVIYAYKHWGAFRDVVQATWHGIQVAASFAWNNVLKPIFDGIWWAIKGVGTVAVWLWQNVFSPVFQFIWMAARVLFAILVTAVLAPIIIVIKAVGAIAMWLWTDGFKPMFESIAKLAVWVWQNALSPVFNWIWDGLKWVGDKFVWLYDHAVKPAAGWIADKASWLWQKALSPVFHWIWNGLKWVGDKFSWLYDHAVKPVANWISDKASWLYDKGLRPAFDNIKSAVGLVGDAFESARKAIKSAWDKVAGIAARPVNFIVDFVYNKGIKAVWDKVAGFVGLDPLPKAPKLLDESPRFADGGRTYGGIPGKDSIPALLMADEFVVRRDSARKIGYENLAYMNATGEIPRFADGGIVGALSGAWDWTKDTVGGVIGKGIDWAKTGADLMTHPGKVWNTLVKPILDRVRDGVGAFPMGDAIAAYPLKMVKSLKDKIVDAVTGGGGGGGGNGGSGVARWRPTVLRALSMTGNPVSYADLTLRRMNQESGGNPTIVNKWDSNWTAGHPSVGLMQVIGPTFRAYAGKMRNVGPFLYGVSTDPLANIYASMRYAMAAYGSLPAAYNRSGGYALGGRVTPTLYDEGGYIPPGMSVVANGTGRPEPVMTASQWADIRAVRGSTSTPNVVVENHTYLGTDEITDILDHRIVVREQQTATALNSGRWV